MASESRKLLRRLASRALVAVLLTSVPCGSDAFADLPCAFLNDEGQVEQAASPEKVPAKYRSRVICANNMPASIPKPDDVALDGLVRTASFVSDLGPINLKWRRADEMCFGKSPSRAVADTAQAVNRAIKSARFPIDLKTSSREWSLVFIDKGAALKQFPAHLAIGGHPGFMLPPNQIYLVTDFIAPQCGNGVVGDAVLTQVLLHEMGHVIEYLILGEGAPFERERGEGFASWFEQYSSDFSAVIAKGSVKDYYRKIATEAMKRPYGGFSGTPEDYARAALQFQAIVDRRGIGGLMDVYKVIREQGVPFSVAIDKVLHWSRDTMDREMKSALTE